MIPFRGGLQRRPPRGRGSVAAAISGGSGGDDLRSLSNLFASGEDGFLFGDFSIKPRQLLLSTGASGNITADDDPVGLTLDYRTWTDLSFDSVLTAQANLAGDTYTMSVNGGTGTATEDPSGQLNLTGDATNAATGDKSFTTVVNSTYRLVITVADNVVVVAVGTTQGGAEIASPSGTVGAGKIHYFVATATTTWVRFSNTPAVLSTVSAITCKLVPGNHALQATAANRPLWKANGIKPYLNFDGSNDILTSPFIPTTAVTLAIATRITNANTVIMGGGSSASKRCYLGAATTTGQAALGWGNEGVASGGYGPDIRGADHVLILTGDGASRDLWLDGVLLSSAAPSGGPDGTGGGVAFGAFNNAGTPAQFGAGRVAAGLTVNRRVTPAEIARITAEFQRTF